MSRILSDISTDRKATIVVLSLLMRSAIFVALLLFISLSTDSERLPQPSGAPVNSKPEPGTSPELPSGMVRSDWDGILRAHRDWKHEVKANGSGWKAHNPATGLTASFDRRGVEVRAEGAAWTWGLNLVSYGVGNAQVSVEKRAPSVETAAREVTYGWDDNLKEWYRNHDHGFEHGYTIKRKPETGGGDRPLEMNLKVLGDLSVTGLEAGRSVVFGKKVGETLLRYSDLKVVDARGEELEARFEWDGVDAFRIVVEDREATYPVTIDPTIAQQAYLKASNTGAGDQFGKSVAISGETVVVGAYGEDSNATSINGNQVDNSANDSGAVYVFVRTGGIWSQQAYLKASNAEADDQFGWSVAISGDTVVVGAKDEASDSSGVNADGNNNLAYWAGAAYVFVRTGGIWSQQAYLKASNPGGFAQFGYSVAISGDTVVVGAWMEDSDDTGVNGNQSPVNGAFNAGAAYVFKRSGATWSQQAYLKASNTDMQDYFGWSVAISGNGIVVGAPGEGSVATGVNGDQTDNSTKGSGAAYVFVRNGVTWSQHAYLKRDNSAERFSFGYSVAVSGDTVVVGGWSYGSTANIFVRSGETWRQQAYLKVGNQSGNSIFGNFVAISGDKLVVGAREDSDSTGVNGDQASSSATDSGAAYFFVRSGETWSQQAYLKASNTNAGDYFGVSVAVSEETIVVGALYEDSNSTGVNGNQATNNTESSGAAYIFIPVANNVPTISLASISRSGGSGALNTTIATIADTDDPIVLLSVKVNGGTSATSNGVTVSSIVNTNGTVTASINVSCGATVGTTSFTLQVSDGIDTSSATLNVQVTANSPPSLSYSSLKINANASSTINPAIAPSDNGSVSSISVNSSGTFTGSVTVNNSTGVVLISNAAPVGTHTITIRTSDNCGATTDAVITLTVNAIPTVTAGIGVSIIGGATSWNSTIATVADADSTAGNLSLMVSSANPIAGVTISNILNSNGTITADILASCSAIGGTAGFTLQVSDGMASATTTLNISVTANTPPTLSYSSQTLASGGSGTVIPVTGPNDNGSVVAIAVHSQGTYTGAASVNSSTGLVTISGATPAGTHTITIRVTDNCGVTTDATVLLTVTTSGGSGPITGGNPSIGLPGSGGSISPGSPVTITQTLANTSSSPATTVYVATLPVGFSAISCMSPAGSCVIGTGTQVSPPNDPDRLRLKSNLFATSASQTVTWSGAIPGNGSVTISYQVQVSVQATGGTQYCVTSTIGGATGPSSCLTVNALSAGPGNPPIFAGLPNTQKPASVLIFNLYTSSVSSNREETQISLTNTNPVNPTVVHLFFVDGTTCTTADQIVTLTQNQTASFMASDIDPGVTGYLIAVAIDASGCPTINNHLIGGTVVRFESDHRATLPAIGVAGILVATPPCLADSTTATLAFNGIAYDELPRSLAIHTLPSPANGNSSMLIINRIGGDLTTGAARLGPLAGLLFDDSEVARSFTLAAGSCQVRGLLGNNFPRTAPRYTTVIPAGRTGWMKFWAVGDEAISGVMINEAVSGLSGGYSLQALTTTNTATLTIPVIPN